MTEEELERYLHEHIPVSAAMGLTVERVDDDAVVLCAPLEPNVNHRATAFGGSVSALAVLTGWSYTQVRLRAAGLDAHTVIQQSSVRYDAPITGPFRATTHGVEEAVWARFVRTLERRGKARLRLEVTVESGSATAAHFRGSYVALTSGTGSTRE